MPRCNFSTGRGRRAVVICPGRALAGWRRVQQQPQQQQPAAGAVPHTASGAAGGTAAAASAPATRGLTYEAANGGQQQQPQQQLHGEQEQPPWAPVAAPCWEPPVGRPGLYDASGRLVLKSLTLPEMEAWCASEGEEAPANRALQLWRWMYADPPAGAWVRRLEDTLGRQNGFSGRFIDKVGSRVSLDGGLQLSQVVRAADGTRKLVFKLTEGEAAGGSVETVLIPIVRQQGLRDRLTICVSSQVGCAMNCQFCYTGRMGLLGNLTTAQIVEQVVEARRLLAEEGDRTQLTNLVFMGMGEPLHNTEAVLAAADIVSHSLGLHLSHNKITISTVGLVPEMRTVLARSRVQMALSLHATTDEVRDWIVPVNRRYDLATLTAALEELFPKQKLTDSETRPQQQQQEQQRMVQGQGAGEVGGCATPASEASGQGANFEGEGAAGRWLPPVGPTTSQPPVVAVPEVHSQHLSSGRYDRSGSSRSVDAQTASGGGGGDIGLAETSSSVSPLGAGVTGTGLTGEGIRGSSAVASSSGGSSGRSLLVEYTMLHGINDTAEDAQRLADMLSRVHCKVNLIVFNPHAGTRFQSSTEAAVTAFRSALVQRGLVCTIRDSRGDDEMAACGQLGNVGLSFRPSPILEAPERFRPFLLPPTSAAAQTVAARL